MDFGFVVSVLTGGLGLALSIISLVIALRVAHYDRINANTWATYEAYNGADVRQGRTLSRQIVQNTQGVGFPDYTAYRAYFGLDGNASQADPSLRQSVQDLAAFYHQTGMLLQRGRLDRDFTLLLVGRGLAERWAVFGHMPEFYRATKPDEEYAYGGIYLLYDAYQSWQRKRLGQVQGQFEQAAKRIARR